MTTLVHPDGKRTYSTDSPREITRLKSHGYTVQADKKPAARPRKPAEEKPAGDGS